MAITRMSIIKLYNSLLIKHKVFALISIIMAGSFFVTYVALKYAYYIYDGQLYSKSSQVLNLSSKAIEEELKRLERLSFSIAMDTEVQGKLITIHPNYTEYDILKSRTLLTDRLVQLVGYEKNIYSVEVIDRLDNSARVGASVPIHKDLLAELILQSDEASGENRWFYSEEGRDTIMAVREIRSYRNLELTKIGTLILHIKLDQIVREVLSGTELDQGEMIIMAGNKVLYPKNNQTAIPPSKLESLSSKGYLITETNGKPYFFTFLKSRYSDWTYNSLIPYDHIFTKILIMKNILIAGFAGSILVLLLIVIAFAKSITRPIEELIARMKLVQMGDFAQMEVAATEISTHQMDEVGHLQRTYRMMMQKIHELITENYSKQILIKETQFKALQAQINPHFLYNTLESINWLAKMNQQPTISHMVESLGFLLRSSISMKTPLIPLQVELEIIKHYITIQTYRFEDRLHFELDIDDELLDYRIPKLTLQPLVENAIQYALEPKVEPCAIRLIGRKENDAMILTVEDEGEGIRPELLDKLQKGDYESKGSGIGLKNIEERIALAFGESYTMQISSTRGQGTQVTLRLPLQKGDFDVQSTSR